MNFWGPLTVGALIVLIAIACVVGHIRRERYNDRGQVHGERDGIHRSGSMVPEGDPSEATD